MILLAALLLLAASPAPAAAPLKLDGLRTAGFVRLSPGTLLTPAETRLVVSEVDAWKAESFNEPKRQVLVWGGAWKPGLEAGAPAIPGGSALYPLMARVGADLERQLPGERLETQEAKLRLGNWGLSDLIHADGQSVTLSLPLRGRGTVLYGVEGEKVESYPADEAAALFTNQDREAATGVPATLHASPAEQGSDRLLFLLRYRSASGPADPKRLRAARELIAQRLEALIRHLEGRGEDPGALTRGFVETLRR